MNPIRQKVSQFSAALRSRIVERDNVVRGALMALFTGEHMVILGPPGTAKSLLTHEINSRISGSNYFEYLFTRFTAPEEVFGPISLSALERDKYERVLDGKLATADIAFLDECFKANSAILNSLLTIMNERKFDNGTERFSVPLMSVFGASNELPEDDTLAALWDRFLFRYTVKYLEDQGNFIDMILSGSPSDGDAITFMKDEIKAIQKEIAENVTVSRDIGLAVHRLRSELMVKGLIFSDRRWRQSIKALKASAYLNGRMEVTVDDLEVYSDILWTKPEDRPEIVKTVLHVISPELAKVQELSDTVEALCRDRENKKNAPQEFYAKIQEIVDQADNVIGNSARVKVMKDQIKQRAKKALMVGMGF